MVIPGNMVVARKVAETENNRKRRATARPHLIASLIMRKPNEFTNLA